MGAILRREERNEESYPIDQVVEALADLPVTVAPGRRREGSAQRHFTQVDQVNQLTSSRH